jgi:hypothetical protein
MSKVFIPQLPTRFDKATGARVPSIDVNPASQFGDLVMMFSDIATRSAAIANVEWATQAILPDDYILAVGDVALLALTIVHTLRRNGRATLLRWDNDFREYRTEELKV